MRHKTTFWLVFGLIFTFIWLSDFAHTAHATHARTRVIEDTFIAALKRHTARDYEVLSFIERVVRSSVRLNGTTLSKDLLQTMLHAAFQPEAGLALEDIVDVDVLMAAIARAQGGSGDTRQRLAGDW